VTSVGTLTDYSKFITAVQKLLDNGVTLEVATANAIMGPNTWARLENLATGIASDKTQLPRPRALQGTSFRVTSALAPSGSPLRASAFMGDFSQLLLGVRRQASIELVRSADYAGKLVWDFVGYGRFDYVVMRPKSFCSLEGIVGT
jgi:HK97 family phage major capsid protein